jgi:hypothetical protein
MHRTKKEKPGQADHEPSLHDAVGRDAGFLQVADFAKQSDFGDRQGRSARGDDPGGGSPGLHKPGVKNFSSKNLPGAEGWGNPVGPSCAREGPGSLSKPSKKLPSAFFREMRSLPAWAETPKEARLRSRNRARSAEPIRQ